MKQGNASLKSSVFLSYQGIASRAPIQAFRYKLACLVLRKTVCRAIVWLNKFLQMRKRLWWLAVCTGVSLFGISAIFSLSHTKIDDNLQNTVQYEFEEFTFNFPKGWVDHLTIKRSEAHANIVVSEKKDEKLFCMYTSFKELDRYQSWLRVTQNMREEKETKFYEGVNFGFNTPLSLGAPHLTDTIKFSREGRSGGVICSLFFGEHEKKLYLNFPQKFLP